MKLNDNKNLFILTKIGPKIRLISKMQLLLVYLLVLLVLVGWVY